MRRAALVCGLVAALPAAAEEQRPFPPPGYFVGSYEFIGRAPGAEGRVYGGWAEIAEDRNGLRVTRCVGGEAAHGRLDFAEIGPDRLPVLQGQLWAGTGMTCEFANDTNNYPRLTCLTYPADDPGIAIPGIESYFPVRWSKPSHTEDCGG